MKKKILLVLFVPLFLAFTCDDDHDYPPIGLEGKWNLVRVKNDFSGYSHDFEKGIIIWNFDENWRSLHVSNNTTEEVNSGLKSLNYHYSFQEIADVCDTVMVIDDTGLDLGCMEIIGDSLKISGAHTDGDTFILVR